MSLTSDYIKNKNGNGEKVLSIFLTAGFPDKQSFTKLALDVLNAGADLLEIGFPFSDPLADGPIIQQSSQAAIENGVTLDDVFIYVKEISNQTDKPVIMMGYANPVLNFGMERFAKRAKASGAAGVIIPDVPIEEYDNFFENHFSGLDVILLVTPTTPNERIKLIDEKSRGFVYCVSVSGTTGMRKEAKSNIEFVERVRTHISKNKMLVGFGISTPDDVESYKPYCDGVIVGSAVIKSLMNENGSYNETLELIRKLKALLLAGSHE
jgi:tryptophan synthase alpha chain